MSTVIRVKKKKNLPPRKIKKTPEEIAKIREREETVLELRAAGSSYAEIAKHLGYKDGSAARKAFNRIIDRMEVDGAKEVISLDLARLDEYQMRCTYALRNNGDLSQIDRLMRIMDMRYRLLGVSDEVVRELQAQHGINPTVVNNKNNVQVIVAAPETQEEFITKMMNAVGVDPSSEEAQRYLAHANARTNKKALPLLEGSANETKRAAENSIPLEEDEIIEAELVEEDD